MKPSIPAIRDLIAEHGEMTRAEIKDFWPEEFGFYISNCVTRMHKRCVTKHIYVARWVRNMEGKRCYLRPVFALGNSRDATKPGRLTKAEVAKRCRKKKRALRQVITTTPNSIFAMAQMAANEDRRAA